ncbi:Fic family protein [Serratia marcescens]|uniref:Fic family protein n=1 Tax=Serratia marcescens TaxID=615 RepID=UPI002FD9CF9E
MKNSVYTRSFMSYRSLSDLGINGNTVTRLESAVSDAAEAMHNMSKKDFDLFLSSYTWSDIENSLRHRLSEHWELRVRLRKNGLSTALAEYATYKNIRDSLITSLSNYDLFIEAIKSTNAACRGQGSSCFRKQMVGLEPDKNGAKVVFGPWEKVAERISELYVNVIKNDGLMASKAIIFFAIILNIHPFRDGNGRTARIWFNALLSVSLCPKDKYLPIRTIMDASAGGLEIRLREAEIVGNWTPLFDYFTSIFEHLPSVVKSRQ